VNTEPRDGEVWAEAWMSIIVLGGNKDRQCAYNVTLRSVRANIVVVEEQ
jgi:hypothetical protein